jgi:hypothetical protein
MTTFTKHHSDFFYGALAAVAIIASILLVFATGTLPEGLERGELIVGFRKALKIAAAVPNYSVTA